MENTASKNNGYLFLMIGIIIASVIIAFGLINMKGNEESVSVKGYAEINVTSDFTVWAIVVNARSTNLSEAFNLLTKNKSRIYQFLNSNGITNEQIGETSLSTATINDYENREYSSSSIKGYNMTQSIVVNSKDITKINQLSLKVNDLLSEGIDLNSQPPEYYVSDIGKYKVQMLGKALKDAKLRAEEIAKSVGNNIGGLKSARQGIFQITPVNSTEVSDWGINDVSSINKTIKSVVDASFSIK